MKDLNEYMDFYTEKTTAKKKGKKQYSEGNLDRIL
jgi:hypothetical protein